MLYQREKIISKQHLQSTKQEEKNTNSDNGFPSYKNKVRKTLRFSFFIKYQYKNKNRFTYLHIKVREVKNDLLITKIQYKNGENFPFYKNRVQNALKNLLIYNNKSLFL
jgi:hypothetical protein